MKRCDGFKTFLEPCFRDIKTLEKDGIKVTFEGHEYQFYGTVSFVATDNLGAQAVGCYFETFSSTVRLCRFCQATKQLMTGVYDEHNFSPITRTRD